MLKHPIYPILLSTCFVVILGVLILFELASFYVKILLMGSPVLLIWICYSLFIYSRAEKRVELEYESDSNLFI